MKSLQVGSHHIYNLTKLHQQLLNELTTNHKMTSVLTFSSNAKVPSVRYTKWHYTMLCCWPKAAKLQNKEVSTTTQQQNMCIYTCT